jgi:hypothetical protein
MPNTGHFYDGQERKEHSMREFYRLRRHRQSQSKAKVREMKEEKEKADKEQK